MGRGAWVGKSIINHFLPLGENPNSVPLADSSISPSSLPSLRFVLLLPLASVFLSSFPPNFGFVGAGAVRVQLIRVRAYKLRGGDLWIVSCESRMWVGILELGFRGRGSLDCRLGFCGIVSCGVVGCRIVGRRIVGRAMVEVESGCRGLV